MLLPVSHYALDTKGSAHIPMNVSCVPLWQIYMGFIMAELGTVSTQGMKCWEKDDEGPEWQPCCLKAMHLGKQPVGIPIEAETKWPPFRRWRFQTNFLEWKCMNFT